LIVVAANDLSGPSTVYKISSNGTGPLATGNVTYLATIDENHLEGVTTIPNDTAMYGPWAGKILAGAEFSQMIYTIDPTSGAVVAYTRDQLGVPASVPLFKVEDAWVIPADSAFYATDCTGCDGTKQGPSRLWTAPASQWTNMVGQVLLAQEYNAQLYVVRWNGANFTTDVVFSGSDGTTSTPFHFEHITFAPDATGDANIQLTPGTATNHVGDPHVLTAHVNVDNGTGFVNAPANTTINFSSSGPGTLSASSCQTVGTTGSCTVTLTSLTTGVTTVHASTDVTVAGSPVHRETGDSNAGDSADATKTWVNAKISIAPDDTNEINQPHTFTVTLLKDLGNGSGFVAAAGETVTVTLTASNGATPTPAGPFTLTTNVSGQASVTFSSPTAGLVIGHATSTLSVGGSALFTVATDGVSPNSGDATKTYVDANIQISPNGTNRVGASHTFTAHVNVNTGSGFANAPANTPITFTIDSGPGTPNPPTSCVTVGSTGSCTTTITSAVTGVTTVSAHTTVTVGGLPLTRDTNGSGGNSGPAVKTWVNARISIAPNATNAVGQPHTFTVTLEKDNGTGTFVAAAGEHVDVTLTDANGAAHSAPTGTCTSAGANTNAAGQCAITFSSNSAGTVTGHATSTLAVNGSAPFTIATDGVSGNSGDAVKTYVDANIQITPSATNRVGAPHTFTAHVNVNPGTGFVNAPDGTTITFTNDNSGPGTPNPPTSCVTAAGSGSCTTTITSSVTGSETVSAHTTVTVGGVALTRHTNGTGANSGPATKTWVNARISIAPNATNAVGQPHTFTVTLQKDNGTGTFVAASGEHVTVTLTDAGGAVHTAPTGTCTAAGANTDANGQCTITFSSNSAGTVTGHATSTLSVNGSAPITVSTNGVSPNSGDAIKTYVDANIQISPATASNPIGTTHTLTGHVNVNPGSGFVNAPDGTTITFSIVSGPGSFVGPSSCTTSGGTGSCTAVITSSVVGITTVKASTNVIVSGVQLHRETGDGLAGDSANAQKTWASPPQLRVVKTPDNGTFTIGTQATYSIVVSNPAPAGSQSATNVTLTDTLPTNGGLTWTSVTTTQGTCTITGGNALSCSLGTIAAQGSVTITLKSVTTTLPMCTSQPNPAAIATADGGLTAQDSGSLSCASGFVSYTQGGWGAPPNGNNVATMLYANFATLYKKGFTIGGNGGPYTGTWTNKYVNGYLTITNWMPDGGTGGKFTQNYKDAVTTSAGVLGTQTASLQLNVDFSNAGLINSGIGFAGLKLTNKQPYLNGYTVAQVLGIANTAIGGGALPPGITYGILSTLLGQINGNFDPTNGSGFNAGYLSN